MSNANKELSTLLKNGWIREGKGISFENVIQSRKYGEELASALYEIFKKLNFPSYGISMLNDHKNIASTLASKHANHDRHSYNKPMTEEFLNNKKGNLKLKVYLGMETLDLLKTANLERLKELQTNVGEQKLLEI